jgi:hypothetical protein
VDRLQDPEREQHRDHRRAADRDERQRDAGDRAIPIVIALLTKTWNRNMKAIPPATTAQ